MGFVAGTLKGDIIVFGGECMNKNDSKTHKCRVVIKEDGSSYSEDYIEAFSILRMNKAGFIFGESKTAQIDGFYPGDAGHGEASVSQSFSSMNSNPDNYT